ncbi:hypothetical protein EVA_15176 [gut metagenome]|uniref:Uncharacterized protein n=1 Tax=gut metagenome TaxID=749906 RepID=J9GBB8_9ZZZZ
MDNAIMMNAAAKIPIAMKSAGLASLMAVCDVTSPIR